MVAKLTEPFEWINAQSSDYCEIKLDCKTGRIERVTGNIVDGIVEDLEKVVWKQGIAWKAMLPEFASVPRNWPILNNKTGQWPVSSCLFGHALGCRFRLWNPDLDFCLSKSEKKFRSNSTSQLRFVADVGLRAPLEHTWQTLEFPVAVERLWRMCYSARHSSARDRCSNSVSQLNVCDGCVTPRSTRANVTDVGIRHFLSVSTHEYGVYKHWAQHHSQLRQDCSVMTCPYA